MLNPSNGIAQRANPQKRVFPNLARGVGSNPEDFPEVDESIKIELAEAGIDIHQHKAFAGKGEVPTTVIGSIHRWGFHRAWYYWVAKGDGIPPDVAETFHKDWGTQVRVDGHCGCPSPSEYLQGFAVSMYHIDTQEGLNAFVKLLASIHKPKEHQ